MSSHSLSNVKLVQLIALQINFMVVYAVSKKDDTEPLSKMDSRWGWRLIVSPPKWELLASLVFQWGLFAFWRETCWAYAWLDRFAPTAQAHILATAVANSSSQRKPQLNAGAFFVTTVLWCSLGITDWLEVLIYFVAACVGIYTMTNVVNWLEQGTKNLPAPLANAEIVGIFLLIIVMLP